ncbi:MAG: hypothetical protein HMLIMOIP_001072 [Candidatus Nitrosomirales archaeon]|jgi:hypothetical protein
MLYLLIVDLHNTLVKNSNLMINAMKLVLQDIIKIACSDRVSTSQNLAILKDKEP